MTKITADKADRRAQTLSAEIGESRLIDSETLFDGAREILIRHAETIYRMRITRQGKLILYK